MPFIGRDPSFPLYPQFGADPTQFRNIMALTFEQDAVTTGQTLNFQVKTAAKEIRVYDIAVEFTQGEVDFTILEGATCTDGVTAVPVVSADRNSGFVSSVFASSDPTGISGGTVLKGMEHFGLPSPIIGFADEPPASLNFVTLKFNSNYIFRFVNVSSENISEVRFLLLFAE